MLNARPQPPRAVPGEGEAPQLLSRADLAGYLGLPVRTLTWWAYGSPEDRRYKTFTIPRRQGGTRTIHAPVRPLRDLQDNVVRLLKHGYRPTASVHGYVPGKSIITNASVHRRQVWVLRVDLVDFFATIHFGRIRGVLSSHPFEYPRDVAETISNLCCHQGGLPLGASTSPILANLVCRGLDRDLAELARGERCYYTRYADDLIFSTDRGHFPASLARSDANGASIVGDELAQVIGRHGFTVRANKTRLMKRDQRQRVTGIIVNNETLGVPREFVRETRALLDIWERHGVEDLTARLFGRQVTGRPHSHARVSPYVMRGRVQYIGSIKGWSSRPYRTMAHRLADLDKTFRPKSLFAPSEPISVQIFAEGKTDYSHLRAAKEYFEERQEFLELDVSWVGEDAARGDEALIKHAKSLSQVPQTVSTVCLFDRDNEKLRRAEFSDLEYRQLGSNVFIARIAPPPWRSPKEAVCIEMLHASDVLKRVTAEGRRVYLREEFHSRSGVHQNDSRLTCPNPQSTTLICDEVFARDSQNVALSKAKFAEMIEAQTPPFESMSFEGFRATFERIRGLVVGL